MGKQNEKTPILVNFPNDLLKRIDAYKKEKDISTRTQAVILLVKDSLDYEEIFQPESKAEDHKEK